MKNKNDDGERIRKYPLTISHLEKLNHHSMFFSETPPPLPPTVEVSAPKTRFFVQRSAASAPGRGQQQPAPSKAPPRMPSVVDLRGRMPPVYDQGHLGSCTANALCAAVQFATPALLGSRLFLYYNERSIENHVADDGGAELCDGVRALERFGVCPEADWPYNPAMFAVSPPSTCYAKASAHKLPTATNVPQNVSSMKQALAAGHPFVVGILVFESFESDAVAASGVVPMPAPKNEKQLGGHAVLCVGYDEVRRRWIMRNSWGDGWGCGGYFFLDYAYLIDPTLASDIWILA